MSVCLSCLLGVQVALVIYSAWPAAYIIYFEIKQRSKPVFQKVLKLGLTNKERFHEMVDAGLHGRVNSKVPKRLIKIRHRRCRAAAQSAHLVTKFYRNLLRAVMKRREKMQAGTDPLCAEVNVPDAQVVDAILKELVVAAKQEGAHFCSMDFVSAQNALEPTQPLCGYASQPAPNCSYWSPPLAALVSQTLLSSTHDVQSRLRSWGPPSVQPRDEWQNCIVDEQLQSSAWMEPIRSVPGMLRLGHETQSSQRQQDSAVLSGHGEDPDPMLGPFFWA